MILKGYILIIFVFLLITSEPKEVYICKGPLSKAYHMNRTCHGLDKCSTKIYKVALENAKKMGRKVCGYED
jgi:hypothetical protein